MRFDIYWWHLQGVSSHCNFFSAHLQSDFISDAESLTVSTYKTPWFTTHSIVHKLRLINGVGEHMYCTYDINKISGQFWIFYNKNLHSLYKSPKCNLQENFVEAANWKTGNEKWLRWAAGGGIESGSCAVTCSICTELRIMFIYPYQYISKQRFLFNFSTSRRLIMRSHLLHCWSAAVLSQYAGLHI
jgi:hypothetical protein